jgi:hypothetical protein
MDIVTVKSLIVYDDGDVTNTAQVHEVLLGKREPGLGSMPDD